MNNRFEELLAQVRIYNDKDENIALITKAWEFATLAHDGQKRASGEPYIIHPLEVAILLSSWQLDTSSIVAGLLHDTIEDGGATNQDLVDEFGEEIAFL